MNTKNFNVRFKYKLTFSTEICDESEKVLYQQIDDLNRELDIVKKSYEKVSLDL